MGRFNGRARLVSSRLRLVRRRGAALRTAPGTRPSRSLTLGITDRVGLVREGVGLVSSGAGNLGRLRTSINGLGSGLSTGNCRVPRLLNGRFRRKVGMVMADSVPSRGLRGNSRVVSGVLVPRMGCGSGVVRATRVRISINCWAVGRFRDVEGGVSCNVSLKAAGSTVTEVRDKIPAVGGSSALGSAIPSYVRFGGERSVLIKSATFGMVGGSGAETLGAFRGNGAGAFVRFGQAVKAARSCRYSGVNGDFSSRRLSSRVLGGLGSFIRSRGVSSVMVAIPTGFLGPRGRTAVRTTGLTNFGRVRLLRRPITTTATCNLNSGDGSNF